MDATLETTEASREPLRLLVVYHSKSGGAEAMIEALVRGAREEAAGVQVTVRRALDATAEDVLAAQAIVLGTPENFGFMSGALKYFFDQVYDELLGRTEGLPYALLVKAGNDGTGAVRAVTKIVTGLRWREVQPPILAVGALTDDHLDRCRDLGAALGAGLELGIY